MIKNLNQLKRKMQKGTRFRVLDHCRPECVGEEREVTYANTQGFYSIVPGKPLCRTSLANNGRGSTLWWSKAPYWDFQDGSCSLYMDSKSRERKYHIITFQVEEQEAA